MIQEVSLKRKRIAFLSILQHYTYEVMRVWKQTIKQALLLLSLLLLIPAVAQAVQSSSSNYQLNEVFFGSGGELNACSGNQYCAKQSAGDLTVGNTKGNQYQAQAGFNTDRSPYIEVVVSNTNVSLGSLAANTTKTANATFTVKAYLAHGYTVINASDPPTNNSYTMNPLAIPTASNSGTEQFGINLAANTSPTSFGADPVNIPDNTFSFGAASPDYSSANLYKYLKNDTVAFSNSSTSTTNYTVSYIFNVSNVTPGGAYVFHHVLVATGTY
jgi:hypothetical protein